LAFAVRGAYGADTCQVGYVWRSIAGDHVCVLPERRAPAATDNRLAASRVDPHIFERLRVLAGFKFAQTPEREGRRDRCSASERPEPVRRRWSHIAANPGTTTRPAILGRAAPRGGRARLRGESRPLPGRLRHSELMSRNSRGCFGQQTEW
jgi:hypothetical protein